MVARINGLEPAKGELGIFVRRWRIFKGLSQNKLAKESGCDPAYINQIERGAHARVSREIVLNIAKVLEMTTLEKEDLLWAAGLRGETNWMDRALRAEVKLSRIAEIVKEVPCISTE